VTPDERREALEKVAADVRDCTSCRLHAQRANAVPGEGHPDTEVVFVGEGPGFNEDREGRPFVGAAGGLLNELVSSVGWRREEVFITNVVKCRPPGNRDPEPDEIAACAPYLRRQLEVLDPALVVTLGRHSLQTFMPGARISGSHGTVRPVDPATGAGQAVAYAMYHPAAALRQGSLRQTMLQDMCGLPEALIRSRARRAGTEQAVEQPVEAAATVVPAASAAPAEAGVPPVPSVEAGIPAADMPTTDEPVAVGSSAAEPEPQMELF
jgi:uracil-DNA glycosylase family 4